MTTMTDHRPILERNYRAVVDRIHSACERVGRCPSSVTLIAVTKYVDAAMIQALYDLGHRDFGESRPQVLWEKAPELPGDVRWHQIGSLQTNKIRRSLPFLHFVHAVDRDSLATALSEEAVRLGRVVPVTVEVNVTGEESKQGYSPETVQEAWNHLASLPGIAIEGLMTMAPLDDDPEQSRTAFRALRELRAQLSPTRLRFLSMGMSGDFEVAIEEGATHVRVGSALFDGIMDDH